MSTTNNLFPYPGNKARHAEWVIQHIPEHTCYVEPFGGAAGVLFNKPKSKVEVYNDLDGDIVHFFEILRNRGDELQEWLEQVPLARELWREWVDEYYSGVRPDDDIERAGRFFYLRYTQFGGRGGGSQGFATRPTRNQAGVFADKVDALDSFSERLRRVVIECEDWRSILDRYDRPETVFYIDPPYQGTEQKYYSTDFDHDELYSQICQLEGRCLVSYAEVPQIYGDGFHIVAKDSTHKIGDGVYGDGPAIEECLISNFNPDDVPKFSAAGQATLSRRQNY